MTRKMAARAGTRKAKLKKTLAQGRLMTLPGQSSSKKTAARWFSAVMLDGASPPEGQRLDMDLAFFVKYDVTRYAGALLQLGVYIGYEFKPKVKKRRPRFWVVFVREPEIHAGLAAADSVEQRKQLTQRTRPPAKARRPKPRRSPHAYLAQFTLERVLTPSSDLHQFMGHLLLDSPEVPSEVCFGVADAPIVRSPQPAPTSG